METLRTRFLPEFLNRVDEVLIFHPLSAEAIHKIVGLQVERLQKMLAEKGIELEVTERGHRRDRRWRATIRPTAPGR